jgi:hydroxyacylglutathione hydrolase
MIKVKSFCFNSFEENTYVLSDESNQCIVIDPGCHLADEEHELSHYIAENQLKPVKLLNTHCHIDHILGNYYVATKYGLKPEYHIDEVKVMASSGYVSQLYQISLNPSPEPISFLNEGDEIRFGNSKLTILFTPGHSPGSVSFYSAPDKLVISGDVLFQQSIGRTDLPGGNYETLMESIVQQLLPLGDDVVVYSGHGSPTTIGDEKKHNPFIREYRQ